MSRVAVRPSNGDNIEKLAFLAPLVGAVGRKLATSALGQGFTAARGGTGIMGKIKEGVKAYGKAKVKDATTGEDGKTDGAAVAAKLAQQTMANQAQARQDRLQNQKEHNMQMADRAKQNSQIAAGEPMDMSWRLLKDWNWNPALKWYEIEAIIRRAKQARKKDKHQHLHSQPMRHYHEQFAERYHPHQKMPIEAIGYEPHEIANAMADLYMENHPELKQALDEHLPHPSDPNQTNPPGMVFHALRTNNPKVSDGTTWTDYSPVVGKPATFGQPQLVSVVNTPAGQASNRHTIRVSPRFSYGHSYDQHNETLPSTFNLVPPLSDVEEKPKRKSYYMTAGLGPAREWSEEEQKIIDERRAQIEAEAAAKQAAKEQAREQELAAREQGELKVELVHPAMPGLYSVTDPAFGIVGETYDASMPRYEYYHNHFLNQQNNVQTGEPMDLSWRLLKREIHPGSLAAYRQMVEDLGDNMPVEQRIAQLLGEGKYLNHPKQFELHPTRPTKQYDYHGDVENLEDVPILNEKLEPFKITDDGYPAHRNLSIYDKHNLSPKRVTYTPEILEREELPTFAGIPFNEETGFTRSEPMDLAMRMLKQMSDEEMQEWAYENLRNQGITIPDEREEEVVPKPEIPTLYY